MFLRCVYSHLKLGDVKKKKKSVSITNTFIFTKKKELGSAELCDPGPAASTC